VRTHIDWLTFTLPLEYPDDTFESYTRAINDALIRLLDADTFILALGGEWGKREKSRAPYTDAWELRDSGVLVFASPTLSHFCVEISGSGCERLIQLGVIDQVLAACSDRVTRIDIASDIETEVTPRDFVAQTSHKRMRAGGFQTSATGETCYVGSQKSERYCRVYRYNPPHPRANLLRVEHVFRKDYAKKVARAYVEYGSNAISASAGVAFGWVHPVWRPGEEPGVDISVTNANHKGNNTVFWLVNSVAPAFKRLVNERVIRDPERFIAQYFMPEV